MHLSLLDVSESCNKLRMADLMLAPSPLKLEYLAWAGFCLEEQLKYAVLSMCPSCKCCTSKCLGLAEASQCGSAACCAISLELLQVPDPRRDERKAETEYPIMVLYDVRLAISLTL